MTLATFFAEEARPDASPLARREDQPTWRDRATKFVQRSLSPPRTPFPIELVEVVLPPGARVAYDTLGRTVGISQQVWLLEGRLALTVGDQAHRLGVGDCLAVCLDRPVAFYNPGRGHARCLVGLTADPVPSRPAGSALRSPS